MKAVVVGGDSKLGAALCTRLLQCGHKVIRTTRRPYTELPARDGECIVDMNLLTPYLPAGLAEVSSRASEIVVYIMAAITGAVAASSHPDAWRVNAEAPYIIAQQARERGWRVVSMSSGVVERAQETAAARQKSYADLAVLMLGGCVVRPLPTVPPEKYVEVADLLISIGETRRVGLVRWEG